jgi:hypothetical protein
MQIPSLIFILLLLSCLAFTQDCGVNCIYNKCDPSIPAANFLGGFDGYYDETGHHSNKTVYQMKDKCIWCQHYKMIFFVTNSENSMQRIFVRCKKIYGKYNGGCKERRVPIVCNITVTGRITALVKNVRLTSQIAWGK